MTNWSPKSTSTGGSDESALMDSLAGALRSIVPRCIGAYLHGSAGRGRLRTQSDIDVLVVTEGPISDTARRDITAFLLTVSGRYPRPPGGPRPIELTVAVNDEVRPWRYPPRCELQYGEWLRDDVEGGRTLDAFVCPDLAVLLTMVLECRAPLFGPAPRHVSDPVPPADLIRATTAGVADLLGELDSDTTNVLLTLARVWHTSVTGALTSKDAAAAWASHLSPRPVGLWLLRARDAYLGGQPHLWGPVTDDVREAAIFITEAIHQGTPPV